MGLAGRENKQEKPRLGKRMREKGEGHTWGKKSGSKRHEAVRVIHKEPEKSEKPQSTDR